MSTRLGIIGGGQLGLYLCKAAQALGVHVSVITDAADDAALRYADRAIVAELGSEAAIAQLLDGCDVITFDKEAIPNETLGWLIEARAQGRVAIHPGADTLLMLKDKALQKTWLQQQNLPTLPFHILSGRASSLESLVATLGESVVQKTRCGGYDGRGVQILRSLVSEQQLWDVPSIVEPFLPDCAEIAVITVRDQSGQLQTYPPVSMQFDAELNSVKTVAMPAAISPGIRAGAIALAERVVTALDGVGVFAVEMFVTPGEELLINEISPRVHNSGHVTLDACNVSQFEQHVRAVTGLPLVAITQESPAVMLNILYSESLRAQCPAAPVVDRVSHPGAALYWYGKAPGTIGRKMGHINALGASESAAQALAARALEKLPVADSEQAA
ncbi:MAG: 5-(carboxyamino)imidazole ribonucleotide synthase [Halieaceae bacterium]|jgi:5-(carboxyamino)imidazole ribonucleotide synthase|nr:5-(carboxyamino)imidazole ribonucleotide synthase [Halieaceae bacterium]